MRLTTVYVRGIFWLDGGAQGDTSSLICVCWVCWNYSLQYGWPSYVCAWGLWSFLSLAMVFKSVWLEFMELSVSSNSDRNVFATL